jgi:hypothetical protein
MDHTKKISSFIGGIAFVLFIILIMSYVNFQGLLGGYSSPTGSAILFGRISSSFIIGSFLFLLQKRFRYFVFGVLASSFLLFMYAYYGYGSTLDSEGNFLLNLLDFLRLLF